MSLIHFTGFDYDTDAGRYFFSNNGDIYIVTPGRHGGRCFRVREWYGAHWGKFQLPTAEQTVIVGMAVYMDSGFSTDIFRLENTSQNANVALHIGSDKKLYLKLRGGAQYIYTNVDLDWYLWFYLELKATIHPTNGNATVKVNGVQVYNGTGLNTAYSSSDLSTRYITLVREGGNYSLFDDVYICNTSGTRNNDFLGDIRVATIFPTRDGSYNDFSVVGATNRYQAVNETTPNGDTNYVTQSGVGLKQTFGFTAPTANASIAGIRVGAFARKDEAGSIFMQLLGKYGTTEDTSGSISLLDSYRYYHRIHETNFSTGNDWSLNDLDSLEYGVKIVES